jgi:hypothetical protein
MASPWLTPEFAAHVRERDAVAAPGAAWSRWAAHRAYGRVAEVALLADERPPNSPSAAYRQWRVRVVPTGRDGWSEAAVDAVVYVELVRVGGVWRVSAVRVSSGIGGAEG